MERIFLSKIVPVPAVEANQLQFMDNGLNLMEAVLAVQGFIPEDFLNFNQSVVRCGLHNLIGAEAEAGKGYLNFGGAVLQHVGQNLRVLVHIFHLANYCNFNFHYVKVNFHYFILLFHLQDHHILNMVIGWINFKLKNMRRLD